MPALMDSLYVALELDPSKFNAGQKSAAASIQKLIDSAEQGGKRVEASSRKMLEGFDKARNGAIEFFAVLTGTAGATDFLNKITQTNAQLGRMAFNMNMNAPALATWGNAAKIVGGSFQGAVQGMAAISQMLELAKSNPSASGNFFSTLKQLKMGFSQNETTEDFLKELNSNPTFRQELITNKPLALQQLQAFGIPTDISNLIERSPGALNNLLGQGAAYAPTQADVAAAQDLQAALAKNEEVWTRIGTELARDVNPLLLTFLDRLKGIGDFLKDNAVPRDVIGSAALAGGGMVAARAFGGFLKLIGLGGLGNVVNFTAGGGFLGPLLKGTAGGLSIGAFEGLEWLKKQQAGGNPDQPAAQDWVKKNLGQWLNDNMGFHFDMGTGGGDNQATVDRVRQSAIANGIDPDIALRVGNSEGLHKYIGDQGTSFGPFQLHYGGGLGDVFSRETGLDARNPATVNAQIDWYMAYVKTHGWHDDHGAARAGISNWQGVGLPVIPSAVGAGGAAGATGPQGRNTTNSSSTQVGSVTVVMPNGSNADDIARNIGPAIRRNSFASQSNFSLA